jgi:hypothetical protein
MANWASTEYVIEGPKDKVQLIFNTIDNFMTGKKPFKEHSCEGWEGNVILELNDKHKPIDFSKSYLRGFFQDYNMDGDNLTISAEEAWGATDFMNCLKKILPELIIYFKTEEEGGDVYVTNDGEGNYFPNRFYIDTCINHTYDIEYFMEKNVMLKYIAEKMNRTTITLEEIKEWTDYHEEINDGDYIYIHEFEVVP